MAAPTINIRFQPQYQRQVATHLSVHLLLGGLTGGLLEGANLVQDNKFTVFKKASVDVDEASKNGGICNIIIQDSNGPLTLVVDEGVCAGRIPDGDTQLSYEVYPSRMGGKVPSRSFIQDHEGLVGVGSVILPSVLTSTNTTFSNVGITWDFGAAPANTKVVANLGKENEDGLIPVVDSKSFNDAIFMLGDVVTHASPTGRCSTSYIKELPPNLAELATFCADIFPKVSEHFLDNDGSYHVFIRNVPDQRLRGVTLGDGGLVDYEAASAEETNYEITRLFTRCMVARWARLSDGEIETEREWFKSAFQGLYSIYFPFRFKLRPPQYFRETLNCYLTSYFSNPLLNTPDDDLPSANEAWHVEAIKAARATMYMIRMDSQMRRSSRAKSTNTERPIDEILREMASETQRGEQMKVDNWIKHVGEWIGHEHASEALADMKSGKYLGFEDMETAFGNSIVLEEQHVLEIGFARNSLNTGVVEGVVKGTNAEKAGLKEGDEIIWYQRPSLVEQNHDAKYKLVVKREGGQEPVTIEWWPRNETKVRAWQSREKK